MPESLPAYEFFDHDADVGILGRGVTMEEAFCAAARALFSIMSDPDMVKPVCRVDVIFREEDPSVALVYWLNGLLGEARAEGLILSRFSLDRSGDDWRGEGWGESWRADLERGVEVKGATFTSLSVTQEGNLWVVRCVVDV